MTDDKQLERSLVMQLGGFGPLCIFTSDDSKKPLQDGLQGLLFKWRETLSQVQQADALLFSKHKKIYNTYR